MNKCALPGCERPHHRKHANSTEEGVRYYCRLDHLYYHERDKQTAAWLRAGDLDSIKGHAVKQGIARQIDAGEHHA